MAFGNDDGLRVNSKKGNDFDMDFEIKKLTHTFDCFDVIVILIENLRKD